MFGLGPIPWPIVTRKRFVRELTEQGESYRQTVARAESNARQAKRELYERTQLFVDSVNKLSGWREEDGVQAVVDAPNGEVQHFHMRTVRDLRGLRTTFALDISDQMLERLRRDSTTAGIVLRSVTEHLTREAILELAERGWVWRDG